MIQANITGLQSVYTNSLTSSSLDYALGTMSTINANVTISFGQYVPLKNVQAALDSLAVPNNSTNLKVVKSKYCTFRQMPH